MSLTLLNKTYDSAGLPQVPTHSCISWCCICVQVDERKRMLTDMTSISQFTDEICGLYRPEASRVLSTYGHAEKGASQCSGCPRVRVSCSLCCDTNYNLGAAFCLLCRMTCIYRKSLEDRMEKSRPDAALLLPQRSPDKEPYKALTAKQRTRVNIFSWEDLNHQ